MRRLAARRIAGQAEISPRGAAALPGEPSQGWPRATNPRRAAWTSRRQPETALRDFECADRSQPCEGATSPCEGWLRRTSPGKPKSRPAAQPRYRASLRKVGPARPTLAGLRGHHDASRSRRCVTLSALTGRSPARGRRPLAKVGCAAHPRASRNLASRRSRVTGRAFARLAPRDQPSQGYVDITAPAGDGAA